jgi:hypothetical protein
VLKRATFLAFAAVWAVLLIYPATEWAAPERSITGRVVDASGAPIAGAEVRIQASLTDWARTGADGRFELRTTRAAGESVYVAAGALDESGEHPAFYNARVAVLVGDRDVELRLDRAAMGDDPAYEFTNPQDCRLCHGAIYDYWQDSPHRDAAKNTWVRDMYDGQGTPGTGANGFVYRREHPGLLGDCAECHAPMDSAKNPGDNTNFAALSPAAREYGVSCDVCHKAYDVGELGLPGVQKMVFARAARETIFGPLPDAAPNFPGVMRASVSTIHQTGELCASCHQANNDHDFDLDYLDDGSVPEESTWSEWLASPYAQPGPGQRTCMDCHMPPKGDLAMCEQYGPVTRDPSQVFSHDFEGTTDEYVRSAGTVRLVARRDAGRLRVAVAVTNDRTGHDLPGGQAIRHAILLVTATDASGATLAFVADGSSTVPVYGGVGDPGAGYWAGLPGRGFAKVFANDEAENVFFSEATRIAADTRIEAGATDWSDYVFELPDAGASVRVEARLVYRRAFRDLVDTKGWMLTGHGRPNPDLIAPDFGVVMGRASVDVPAPGPAVDAARATAKNAIKLAIAPGAAPVFADGATVELTDATGAWVRFSTPARVMAGGTKLSQKGKIDGLKLRQFWENGVEKFLRVTNPDGGTTVLRFVRDGNRLVAVG